MLLYQILTCSINGKIYKSHTKRTNLKYHLQRGTKDLIYLMDHTLHEKFKIIWSIPSKKHETLVDNPLIRIYVNKIENRITFKIKTGYYLERLASETMKLQN